MQDYNTILGVIQMRLNGCSYDVIRKRYRIGSSTAQLIIKRFRESGLALEQLRQMEPKQAEAAIFPPENLQRRKTETPDFQYYYDRIHAPGSRVNISFCWIDYKQKHPDGYGKSQFYEYYERFVSENYGGTDATMAVERIPGEKMYIDWVGDHPALLTDPETGEIRKVHVFATTLGISSRIYAENFMDEQLPQFIAGVVHAVSSYGGAAKYFVPDNLRTAITTHTKDRLVTHSAFSDLEDFYETIVLPPPPRKPRGKATVENHVRFLETHLVERLREKVYTSLEELNAETRKIVAALNSQKAAVICGSRDAAFEKYDRPCLRPLPGGEYTVCDYKPFTSVPDNYHLEYDGHYYSLFYTYQGQPAILKATPGEIRICDQYNRLICSHVRSYKEFPKYITKDEHMKPEHLYYKEVNSKDGAYYRRWAAAFGPYTSEFIDRMLKSSKHEEQSYNSCAGILHSVKDLSHGIVEDVSRSCIGMNSCWYSTFKRVLRQALESHAAESDGRHGTLPHHSNIRGKEFYQ